MKSAKILTKLLCRALRYSGADFAIIQAFYAPIASARQARRLAASNSFERPPDGKRRKTGAKYAISAPLVANIFFIRHSQR